ncbi:MAG: hypothetical protein WBX25_20270 [Rhodomicrobium sp.]
MMAAKAMANKGCKMVLLSPQPNVEKVLETTGVNTVIPVVHDVTAASAIFGS